MNTNITTVMGMVQGVKVVGYLTIDEMKRVAIDFKEGQHSPGEIEDILIVNPNQLVLKKEEIGVFRHQGGTTIKICMPLPGNKGMILQARNPRAESYVVTPDTECTVIGKVIFKIVKCK